MGANNAPLAAHVRSNNVIAPVAAGGMRGQQCGYRRKSNIALINEGGQESCGVLLLSIFPFFWEFDC